MRHIFFQYIIVFLFGLAGWPMGSSAQEKAADAAYQGKLVEFQNLLQSGRMSEGLDLLNELIETYPDRSEAYYTKSLLHAQAGDYETALELAEKTVEMDPSDFTYNNHLMSLYKVTNNIPAVITVLNNLEPHYPNNKLILREKILLQHVSGDSDAALQSYEEAVARVGKSDTLDVVKSEVLLDQGRYADVQKLLEPWYQQQSMLKEVYGYLAVAYNRSAETKKAIRIIEDGLKYTDNALLYFDLADIHSSGNKSREAHAALKKAFESTDVEYVEKHRVMSQITAGENILTAAQKQDLADVLITQYPRIADNYVFKADGLWQNNQLGEARALYLTALGISPKEEDTWRRLINVEIAMNALDEAIGHGQEALIHFPGHVVLNYFVGMAYFLKEDTDNARMHLEEALNNSERENDYVKSMVYGSLGDLYHKLDMVAVSDAAYEEAIKLDESNASALNNLAYYLSLRKERLDKAAEYAQRANELDPTSGTFQDTYAWVLFQQGNYTEAHKWIEKAVKNSKPSAVVLEHYGDILSMVGKEMEAVKQWQRALNLSDGDESVNVDKLKEKIREKKYIE